MNERNMQQFSRRNDSFIHLIACCRNLNDDPRCIVLTPRQIVVHLLHCTTV